MGATLRSLAAEKIEGRRLAVLGTMLELGEFSDEAHAGLAPIILETGVDELFLVGEPTRPLADALEGKLPVTLVANASEATTRSWHGLARVMRCWSRHPTGSGLRPWSNGWQGAAHHALPDRGISGFSRAPQPHPLHQLPGGAATATALAIGLLIGPWFINYLRCGRARGQPIRADGPQTHLAKRGTPTMGGLLILVS
jgi:hypothetical protein